MATTGRKVVYGRSNQAFPLMPVGKRASVVPPAPAPKIQLSRKAAPPKRG